MSVMIGMPALNESSTIFQIVNIAKQYGQVVVVDDGSTDNTSKLAQESGAIVISHLKNMGYGKSISDLFTYAKKHNFQNLIVLDSDGQHNPIEIPNFLKALKNNDIVIGNRFLSNSNTPKYREIGVKIFKIKGLSDTQNGFRAFNKKAIDLFSNNLYEKGMGISIEILKVAKLNNLIISEISSTVTYKKHEKHSQNPFSHGLDLFSAFAWWMLWENPSKTLFPLGLLFLLGTFITGIQTLSLYSQFHEIVQTWALLTGFLLICTFLIFNSLIFILVFKNRKVQE